MEGTYYKQENNNIGAKILLVIIILFLICLTCYKFFIYDKKKIQIDNTDITSYDKISYEEKEENGSKKLYIGKKNVDFGYPLIEELKVEQYKDILIAKVTGPGPSRDIYAIDIDGNITKFDYSDDKKSDLYSNGPSGYRIDKDFIIIEVSKQYGNGYVDWYCHYNNKKAISNYEVQYEYLGNNKFSNGKVINEKTIEKVYIEELKKCGSKEVAEKLEDNLYTKYLNKLSDELESKYDNTKKEYIHNIRVGGYAELSYRIELSKDKVLRLEGKNIVGNVLEYFVVDNGNGGARSLYYITTNGDLYKIDHEVSLHNKTNMKLKKLPYKNIVSVLPGLLDNSRGPIFIDIEGNMYIGEDNTSVLKSNTTEYTKYLSKLNNEINNKYNGTKRQYMSSNRTGAYGELTYYIELSKDKILKINDKKVADNVLEYFVSDNGNGGAKSLYYITTNGELYKVNHEVSLYDKTDITPKKLLYKNIVSVLSGVLDNSRGPIFIDIEGNMYTN